MNPELWHAHPVLVLLSWLPVPLGTLALWLPAWPPFARRFSRPWVTWLFFVFTRLAAGAVLVGTHRPIDWGGFEWLARMALAGQVPYRDFPTTFAPGLPYLMAAGYLLSPVWGFLVLFILADLTAFLTLSRLCGDVAPRTDSPAWAYLAFPPVWYFETRYGQEEALAALFLALALLALARQHVVRTGLALAAGQLATKILFGLAALPLLFARRTPLATRVAYLAPVAAAYLVMPAIGMPWWRDIEVHAVEFGVGPTLWRLPALWLGLELGRFAMLPFAALLALGWWRLWRREADGVELGAWLWGCFALLAPKMWPMYVVVVSPLLAVWVSRGGRPRFIWWGLYGFAFSTVWYADSGPIQGLLGPAGVALAAFVLTFAVALDAWLLLEVWRRA